MVQRFEAWLSASSRQITRLNPRSAATPSRIKSMAEAVRKVFLVSVTWEASIPGWFPVFRLFDELACTEVCTSQLLEESEDGEPFREACFPCHRHKKHLSHASAMAFQPAKSFTTQRPTHQTEQSGRWRLESTRQELPEE